MLDELAGRELYILADEYPRKSSLDSAKGEIRLLSERSGTFCISSVENGLVEPGYCLRGTTFTQEWGLEAFERRS